MPGLSLQECVNNSMNCQSIENGSEKIFYVQQMAADSPDTPSNYSSTNPVSSSDLTAFNAPTEQSPQAVVPAINNSNTNTNVNTDSNTNTNTNVNTDRTDNSDSRKPDLGSSRKSALQWDQECSVEMEIISDPHFLMNCLRDRVIGQKRCDRESQFVIFMDTHVLKGPYRYEQVSQIFYQKDFLVRWQTPHIVLPEEIILSAQDGYFLRYPNLAHGYPIKYRWHTEKFKTLLPSMTRPPELSHSARSHSHSHSHSHASTKPGQSRAPKEEARRLQYRVLRKRGLISLYDYFDHPDHPDHTWVYQLMPTLLLALIHCYILRIGDMCLSNILVDIKKRQIYLIDLDDTLENDRKDEFFYFRSRPDVTKAAKWLQQARLHYPWLIEQLGHIVPISLQFKHRIRNTIFRLARYVYTPESDDDSSSESSSDSSSDSSSNSSSDSL